jgi:transcriptional regulator with XRE-family HTH domain
LHRKVSLDELAEWLGTSAERVQKFERGIATPTIQQLRKMSQAFKVPLYAYKRGLTPNLDPIPDDFRKRDPHQADLSPAGLAKLWSVERIADFTNEIIIGLKDAVPDIARLPMRKREALKAPEEIRERVDRWIARHGSVIGREKSDALTFSKKLRLYIERHGCLVSYDDAPSTDYLGFYKKFNARTPLAFVNRKAGSQKAALFTLAHEWAHHLCDEEGISDPWVAKNSVERSCNQFAAEFLAPASQIKSFIERVWTPTLAAEDIAGRPGRRGCGR